jgi:hypothetical protein
VKYLATLLGQADEVVLRWFILVVALCWTRPRSCSCCPLQGRARYGRRPRQVHPSNRPSRLADLGFGLGPQPVAGPFWAQWQSV